MATPRLDLFAELERLALPDGEYLVLGSGILGALGLRDVADIDLLVTPALFERLKNAGWGYSEPEIDGRERQKLQCGPAEAFQDCWYGTTQADPQALFASAVRINGFPFLSLEKLLEIKRAMHRQKDRDDLLLIQRFLAGRNAAPMP